MQSLRFLQVSCTACLNHRLADPRVSHLVFFQLHLMFASIVSDDRCQLYCVVRTDCSTSPWTRTRLSYAPRDYMGALQLAQDYQRRFDPNRERWSYRVAFCD